ncbi:DUF2169 domain-containing protein [Myxococcus stipitatus]|uniref:DUF2169 family type VI secretion system accessory protein n=1 Tax=Myxococcus stipitatus TaxID=83455 RepID=UPI00314533A7
MLQVRNETPFVPGIFLFPDAQGVDTLYVVVKATFEIGRAGLQVAEKQQSLVLADEYWGEPAKSSLKYASEAHLLKPGTDVVLVGDAHAPKGQPVPSSLVSVKVGALRKVVQVFGNRHWTGGLVSPSPSRPEPFLRMPLVYELAYGGVHVVDAVRGKVLAEERNPVGHGFRGKRSASEMAGQPLPNLEDPLRRIHCISDAPTPTGFGFVAPSWQPRQSFAGTYDEAWQTQRAPYLPLNFRSEFFLTGAPELCTRHFLKGGEPVEIIGASRDGAQRFRLPTCALEVAVKVAGQQVKPSLQLETLLLEPGEGRFSLLWRGAVPCDKQTLKVEQAHFQLHSLA